MQWQNICDEVL